MDAWIRRPFPLAEPEARLICFPHAGGSANAYRPLANVLKDRVETLTVQYPGRQDRYHEAPARQVDELVDGVLNTLKGRLDDRPLGLFGHSMGATVAFETARRLEYLGRPVTALLLSARSGPSSPRTHASAEQLSAASDATLIEELRLLGGSEEEILAFPEVLELALPVLRADYRLLSTYEYHPGRLLTCPITTLVGDSDPRVPAHHMYTWQPETRSTYTPHILPGGHFYLRDQLPAVARIVETALFTPANS